MMNLAELLAFTDAMINRLRARASELAGCLEGSEEEAQLRRFANRIDRYQAMLEGTSDD